MREDETNFHLAYIFALFQMIFFSSLFFFCLLAEYEEKEKILWRNLKEKTRWILRDAIFIFRSFSESCFRNRIREQRFRIIILFSVVFTMERNKIRILTGYPLFWRASKLIFDTRNRFKYRHFVL